MSTYTKITRHPHRHKWELATWHDDYFGPHLYGVQFESDKVVYPATQINDSQIKEFWAADVIEAYKQCRPCVHREDQEVATFLNEVEHAYKNRWKRDPSGGEGMMMYYGPHPRPINSPSQNVQRLADAAERAKREVFDE